MTTTSAGRDGRSASASLQARLTAALAGRQFGLLFLVATSWLFMWFFFNYLGLFGWEQIWSLPAIPIWRVAIPAILVLVYGYVLLVGLLFALGPSERSFNLFFYGMIGALLLVNYDHTLIDWLTFQGGFKPNVRGVNPVSAIKIALAGPFFLFVILMHYNILADDFTRRMMRRGVPSEEALRIRPGMLKVLFPTVFAAAALAAALALLGEVSAFVFQYHGLFVRKLNLVLLAILGIAVAFTLRAILREMLKKKSDDEAGPNR